jgi:hypothetical protein
MVDHLLTSPQLFVERRCRCTDVTAGHVGRDHHQGQPAFDKAVLCLLGSNIRRDLRLPRPQKNRDHVPVYFCAKCVYDTLDEEQTMLDHISFHLSQKGPAMIFSALAFLFCGALLLGFL